MLLTQCDSFASLDSILSIFGVLICAFFLKKNVALAAELMRILQTLSTLVPQRNTKRSFTS